MVEEGLLGQVLQAPTAARDAPIHLPSVSTSPSLPLPPTHTPHLSHPAAAAAAQQALDLYDDPKYYAKQGGKQGGEAGGAGRRRWLGVGACCCVLAGWRRRGVIEEGRMACPNRAALDPRAPSTCHHVRSRRDQWLCQQANLLV